MSASILTAAGVQSTIVIGSIHPISIGETPGLAVGAKPRPSWLLLTA
jgi:hypothetical protein